MSNNKLSKGEIPDFFDGADNLFEIYEMVMFDKLVETDIVERNALDQKYDLVEKLVTEVLSMPALEDTASNPVLANVLAALDTARKSKAGIKLTKYMPVSNNGSNKYGGFGYYMFGAEQISTGELGYGAAIKFAIQ